MRIIQFLFILLFLFTSSSKSTPNLFVELSEVILKSDNLTVIITRDEFSDRVSSIEVKTPKGTFNIESKIFRQAYAIDLQNIELTQAIDLNEGLLGEYQLYIPYNLHSNDGSDPPEEQNLQGRQIVIYFTNTKVIKTYTEKM